MAKPGTITVAVRVRPPSAWETARLPDPFYDAGRRADGALSTPGRATISSSCLREVVKVVDDRILMFDPDEKDKVRAFAERGFVPPGTKRYKDKRFMFDRVFDTDARQPDVYQGTARPLLDGLLDGYNATVFAYGATGCGKTHTISGTDSDPGIIYLTMADLFEKIEERRSDYNVDIYVTFLEIYNEEIRDLLAEPGTQAPRGGLQIREDKTVKVIGLVELHPASADEIKNIVLLGNTRRTQSPTHANETSSRSHAVLQVHVSQSPRTASTTEECAMATLSIIDLAGSERAAATTNMGQRMVEGANINKSLLALGNCINALCESGGATRHIPYRNSKLTRLLKFSLGGNCKTVMIVCVAPTSNHFDDTHNTLLYADRASKIKTKVVTRNVVNVDRHVGQYVEAINRLNLEVAELKAKLAGKIGSESAIAQRRKEQGQAEVDRAKEDMRRKVDQVQPCIVDGAARASEIFIGEAKAQAYKTRLEQVRAQLAAGTVSQDLLAEQGVLQALIATEEASIMPGSTLQTQYMRSQNASSMFDATLRAMSERRSDRLDESHIESLKMEAQNRKLGIEALKKEAQLATLQRALAAQSATVASLVGILGRCTVLLESGSRSLQNGGPSALEKTHEVSASLHRLAESNNEVIEDLFGHRVDTATCDPSVLAGFSSYPVATDTFSVTRRSSSVSASGTLVNSMRATRRSSLANLGVPDTSRRRSPRKPRTSLLPHIGHSRRSSIKVTEKKKGVQWKDEAGQGSLEDARESSMATDVNQNSMRISESEWEDERTEDNTSQSFLSSASFKDSQREMQPSGSAPKRPSRLDPSFLKSRTGSTLSSLVEVEEPKASTSYPFGSRLGNGATPGPSSIVQTRQRASKRGRDASPDQSAIPTAPSSRSPIRPGRRNSLVGPLRSARTRRRSSLLQPPPVLVAPDRQSENTLSAPVRTGARRVPIVHTPSKRPRRPSILASRAPLPIPTRSSLLRSQAIASSSNDANSSSDLSFKGKPSWR